MTDKHKTKGMTEREAIERIQNDLKLHHDDLSGQYRKALRLAISTLKKQEAIKSCTPPSDDWEYYADRLHDIAYQSGYEQGKKDAEQDKWISVTEKGELDGSI